MPQNTMQYEQLEHQHLANTVKTEPSSSKMTQMATKTDKTENPRKNKKEK